MDSLTRLFCIRMASIVAPQFKSQPICNFFAGINKTDDGSRTAEKGDAHRDVTMARLAETFLVRAECYVRLGQYGEAMSDINVVRARAQWKNGENRSFYSDGLPGFCEQLAKYRFCCDKLHQLEFEHEHLLPVKSGCSGYY